MSGANPLPRVGEVFFDERGEDRALRLSWHPDAQVMVISIWNGGVCSGTFRLPARDIPAFMESMSQGMPTPEPRGRRHATSEARTDAPGEPQHTPSAAETRYVPQPTADDRHAPPYRDAYGSRDAHDPRDAYDSPGSHDSQDARREPGPTTQALHALKSLSTPGPVAPQQAPPSVPPQQAPPWQGHPPQPPHRDQTPPAGPERGAHPTGPQRPGAYRTGGHDPLTYQPGAHHHQPVREPGRHDHDHDQYPPHRPDSPAYPEHPDQGRYQPPGHLPPVGHPEPPGHPLPQPAPSREEPPGGRFPVTGEYERRPGTYAEPPPRSGPQY